MSTTKARQSLNQLISALENHFEVACALDGEQDESPALDVAEEQLRDAFFTYDDALFTSVGVELPFDILDEDDLDDDEGEDSDSHDSEDDFDGDYLVEDDLEDFDLNEED